MEREEKKKGGRGNELVNEGEKAMKDSTRCTARFQQGRRKFPREKYASRR